MCIEETAAAPRKAASRDIHFGTIFKIGGKYPNLAIIGLNSPKHLRFLIHAQDTTHGSQEVAARVPGGHVTAWTRIGVQLGRLIDTIRRSRKEAG